MEKELIYRWTVRRKAEVLRQIEGAHLSDASACAIYGLSAEELAAWRRDFAAHGAPGLRATRVQAYAAERRADTRTP